ncbi:T9SS C-terminal target domain-containing protein [Chryseobacterium sp. G0186]|uniref:T9SS type A sorting domain-containing protein n=1 Tax=Chryseobacterium sp. G0186 TaxID=2487064 RepID=UPI000F4E05DF|nr:T9SS type A sorting domain-containing protein [Chryseobacterium sp. G0186]AZA78429.1 T9SS C-terminal target domain-containing protein [Chryseobacterium sp. G0186]
MIGGLYFAVRKLRVGIILILMAGNILYAQQGAGIPQGCNNTDPGNNVGDVGCVTFTYQGQPVTYTTVRGGDGKIWLRQNLGSLRVANAIGDTESYGDLFQWGRWDDGHQLRNSSTTSAPAVNSPKGLQGVSGFITGSPAWWLTNGANDKWLASNQAEITETEGMDPCKAIGSEWRLPTQADWATIIPIEGITSPTKAFEGSLKLPMAGFRSSDGGLTFAGQKGYYWSSDATGIGGKYLFIGTTISNASAGAPKWQGSSVRCIKTTSGLGTSENNKNRSATEVYPNPTNGILMVKANSGVEQVKVVNAVGQIITVPFSDNQINMNGLSQGLYMIELKLKNGQSVFKKIMKN